MVTIDNEFENLIPPLTDDEYAQLEINILRDGIRDALITWHGILIDGHNRYRIAQKHGLTYRTVEKQFTDRNDAERWIILNQFGRRNLSAYDRSILALKLKPIIAEKAKEKQVESGGAVPQKSAKPPVDTRQELAKVAGVSHDTIAKVEKIQAKASPEIKSAIKSGEMSINQAYQTLKREEKKIEIEQAEKKVADEYKKQEIKPVIHVGDSFDYEPSEPYKLLLTDPPYSTDVANIDGFAKSWLPKALKNVRDDGFAYVFIGAYPEELKAYLNVETPAHIKLEQVLIWTYKNTLGNNPKDRYKLNYQACLFYRGINAPALDCPITNEQWAVQEINAPDGRIGDRYHAWQKPMEIAERFIRHSTKSGDTVFDPFACTGTFLLASAKLGRKAYGIEINPENAEIAIKRGCVYG